MLMMFLSLFLDKISKIFNSTIKKNKLINSLYAYGYNQPPLLEVNNKIITKIISKCVNILFVFLHSLDLN